VTPSDSPSPDIAQALARLSRPELAPIVDVLAGRLAQTSDAAPVRLTLRGLTTESRQALADLLGSDRLPATDLTLRVERLLAALGLPSSTPLRSLVEPLRGPLGDRRAQHAAAQATRDALWTWLAAQAAQVDLGTGPDRLAPWVAALRAGGVRGGAPARRARLEAALAVLRALPADGASLASFAADVTGDPHALDHGSALSALVLDAISVAVDRERPAGAEAARELWESVGVVPDPLSSTVLALGLRGAGDSGLAHWLSTTADAAEPVMLTLANLRRWPVPAMPPDTHLFVVENPSLVIEAASRHWAGPPLVCSSGRPSVATVTLLRQLTAAGARALQHADFDPAGLSITQWLARQAGTIPWRMTASDYAAAVGRQPALDGAVPPTPWDGALRELLLAHGRPVYEEQLRDDLLAAMLAERSTSTD
jgi:uncharacterized protein (TIGR02679 family)